MSVKDIDLEALATWNQVDGGAAKLEASYHPWKNLEAYAAGTWAQQQGLGAEVGVRYTISW